MRIQIDKIKVSLGRREALPEHIEELAKSIAEVGLLNPITVDRDYTLIAGLHRLEAAKSLGWAEIECTVSTLEGLQAELAEIDENFVRRDLSAVEFGDLLLRRKEIYETLHPETKAGVAQAVGMNRAIGNNVAEKFSATSKPFVQDTAEKLGVTPRLIRRQIQTSKNLTAEAKDVIRHSGVSKEMAFKLSRLAPEQQEEAAELIVAGKIKSVDEYLKGQAAVAIVPALQAEQTASLVSEQSAVVDQSKPTGVQSGQVTSHSEKEKHGGQTDGEASPRKHKREKKSTNGLSGGHNETESASPPDVPSGVPYSLGGVKYASVRESVADLKNPKKDCSNTPDSFLAEITEFVRKFQQEISWFHIDDYEPVFPALTQVQFEYFQQQIGAISEAAQQLSQHVQKGRDKYE